MIEFLLVMIMRRFVIGGRFIVALNLQRFSQPKLRLVLANLRVKIQGSRISIASSRHGAVTGPAMLVTVEGRVMASHQQVLLNLLMGMTPTVSMELEAVGNHMMVASRESQMVDRQMMMTTHLTMMVMIQDDHLGKLRMIGMIQ